ncbi:MAG: site-specific DNA-methyltransferase, partial [Alphaproteobacteria bacterium]|nr:site-specific DNA-methyltransferase [Alphaproteobacteria bacterium]
VEQPGEHIMKDIDFALVETKRPPMYTAMKYWGKKPHNIWETYIENYTSENDVILDPFSGSAIAAFEAVKCGRKAIAFDINPLTSFIIKVYSTNFNEKLFASKVSEIVSRVESDDIYKDIYLAKCTYCGYESAIIQHAKWENSKIFEVGIVCPKCKKRFLAKPNVEIIKCSEQAQKLHIPFWYPKDVFDNSPSFTESFKKNIGGNSFNYLWTKRNLYVLSEIFDEILSEKNADIKLQLLFGFIQTLHLSSKMCVPRRESSNRSFSTSWGRSAYICSNRQMEMNPLLLFKNSCIGKQSVQSALKSVVEHIGKVPKSKFVTGTDGIFFEDDFDILYGIIDIKDVSKILPNNSISFIITDPPYGGLVQYMDLSCIWLNWLKHYDAIYTPSMEKEITIKKGVKEIEDYRKEFTNGIKALYNVLSEKGKIVFTFHNKDIMVWNAFLRSISQAGFKVEKVIHQQNKRSGESNVANPYGTSASDFYIRCSKSIYVTKIQTTKDAFENFIVERAVSIIKSRNEPTPYQMLFNGLLAEISKVGFELENFDENIQHLLSKHTNDVFEIVKTNQNSGDLWWLKNYSARSNNVIPLTERVENTISTMFKNEAEYTLDDILGEIFVRFPNGLTPDIRNVETIIKKYADKSGNKWVSKKGHNDGR